MLGPALTTLAGGITAFAASPYMQFGLGLLVLGTSMALFGMYIGPILLGALAISILTIALTGIMGVLGTMMPNMQAFTTTIETLVGLVPAILQIAGAISVLAFALTALGIAGIIAAPAMLGLGLVGGFAAAMGMGGGDKTSEKLLEEIIGLREDLNNGKVAVYLDGKKMSNAQAITSNRYTKSA